MTRLLELSKSRFRLAAVGELAALMFLISSGASAQRPMLIPQPRELQTQAASFAVTSDLQIVLLPGFAERDRSAAQSIQQELAQVTQHEFPISSPALVPSGPAILLGSFTEGTMAKLVGRARYLNQRHWRAGIRVGRSARANPGCRQGQRRTSTRLSNASATRGG